MKNNAKIILLTSRDSGLDVHTDNIKCYLFIYLLNVDYNRILLILARYVPSLNQFCTTVLQS
jgi:hypothetical protein